MLGLQNMRKFAAMFARTPYRYKGNPQVIGLGLGVDERGFIGTSPGAPFGFQTQLAGTGGFLVKRNLRETASGTYQVPPGVTQSVGIGGLTGGLYQTGAQTLAALQSFVPQQPYNGQGPAPI